MRAPIALLLTTAALGVASCGGDELQQFRDTADQAVQDVKDNASPEKLQNRLDEVQKDLKQSDLPDQARQELEQARDELQKALN